MPATARTIHQLARPDGFPTADLFRAVEHALPALQPGQALVENLYLSVDPYMRQLMSDGWPLNAPLGGGRAIGRVMASRWPALAEGRLVFHNEGWSTHAVVDSASRSLRPIDPPDGVPTHAYLSVLGGTGLTAYVGMREILDVRPGESVYVSAAAGGVGSVAGQIARLLGAGRVVGSAGSAAKAAHAVRTFGFDAAFDYHDGPVVDLLAAAAPDGLHATLEGVGGDHLEAAIAVTRPHGRIAWVGAISQYHRPDAPPCAPGNLFDVSEKSITLRGYAVRDYRHLQGEAESLLIPALCDGRVVSQETISHGFETVVDAFLAMLRGESLGKTLVALGEP